MKTNPRILATTIALLTSAAFGTEPVKKNESSAAAAALSFGGGGKATITIDVNGKRETREIEIGNGTEIKITPGGDLDVLGSNLQDNRSLVTFAAKSATWLGVGTDEAPEELRAQLPPEYTTGLILRSILPDSPAAGAGLQRNDVLVKIDDQLLANPGQLRALVSAKKDGDTIQVTYLRRGQPGTIGVKLATHQEGPADDSFSFNYQKLNPLTNIPVLGKLFDFQTRAVTLDASGKVIDSPGADLTRNVEQIARTLREVGVDERTINDATRSLAETTNEILDAVSKANTAKEQVQKGTGEIAKTLETLRDVVLKMMQLKMMQSIQENTPPSKARKP